ncbi:MAG: hypothetical protein ACTSPQ_18080 [Candidatus Helarchaeota archaeon]
MPNRGNDYCGNCPFNGVNKGKLQYSADDASGFYCKRRKFSIEKISWTYCNNHPQENSM